MQPSRRAGVFYAFWSFIFIQSNIMKWKKISSGQNLAIVSILIYIVPPHCIKGGEFIQLHLER